MNLTLLPHLLAVCRTAPDLLEPNDFTESPFWSATRTADELSIVVLEAYARPEWRVERGWRALMVAGPLDFALVGILATLAQPLAQAGIPIFVISTFDTDYLLVKGEKLDAAVAVLRQDGHLITAAPA